MTTLVVTYGRYKSIHFAYCCVECASRASDLVGIECFVALNAMLNQLSRLHGQKSFCKPADYSVGYKLQQSRKSYQAA
jgi:hypothetical protein